jgi:hypothetical protein
VRAGQAGPEATVSSEVRCLCICIDVPVWGGRYQWSKCARQVCAQAHSPCAYRPCRHPGGAMPCDPTRPRTCLQEGNQVALVQRFCGQGDLLKLLTKCGGRMNERAAVQVGSWQGLFRQRRCLLPARVAGQGREVIMCGVGIAGGWARAAARGGTATVWHKSCWLMPHSERGPASSNVIASGSTGAGICGRAPGLHAQQRPRLSQV